MKMTLLRIEWAGKTDRDQLEFVRSRPGQVSIQVSGELFNSDSDQSSLAGRASISIDCTADEKDKLLTWATGVVARRLEAEVAIDA